MKKTKNFLEIQIAFLIYSLASFFSKNAGISENIKGFILFYILSFGSLGIYAIIWQRILKKNSLTNAYLNKVVTLLWGLLFGNFFFKEKITINMIVGIIIIAIGIIIVNLQEEKQ